VTRLLTVILFDHFSVRDFSRSPGASLSLFPFCLFFWAVKARVCARCNLSFASSTLDGPPKKWRYGAIFKSLKFSLAHAELQCWQCFYRQLLGLRRKIIFGQQLKLCNF
jgi:hypothetical protein